MAEKFGKWLFGQALSGLILMFVLPLLGIAPNTKRFYSSKADIEWERNEQVRARTAAFQRLLKR